MEKVIHTELILFKDPSVIVYCSDFQLDKIYEPLLKKTKSSELPEYVEEL